MKPTKPRTMWAIVDASGDIYAWTVSYYRQDSIRILENSYCGGWVRLKQRYRCVKLNVSEVGK